jgi:hypothetical protein
MVIGQVSLYVGRQASRFAGESGKNMKTGCTTKKMISTTV